jgi:hypothetical protein
MNPLLLVAAALAVPPAPSPAADPLKPGYQPGQWLEICFREYRVSGPGVDKPGEGALLVCLYSTRPVVMVYTRTLDASVVRLVKAVDAATAAHWRERLGSYVVLLCEGRERQAELLALAEKEGIRNTLLSFVAFAEARPRQRFDDKFGAEAETTIVLATAKRQVKTCHAFRKGELTDAAVRRILGELPLILPRKD